MPVELLETRTAPSDSLGLLFAGPLAELMSPQAEITAAPWHDSARGLPSSDRNSGNETRVPRFITSDAPSSDLADLDRALSWSQKRQRLEESAQQQQPTAPPSNTPAGALAPNVLDRILANLDWEPPRAHPTPYANSNAAFDATALFGVFAADTSSGATTPTASASQGAPSAAPASDDGGSGGGDGTDEEPIAIDGGARPRPEQVDWAAIAIALADQQGRLESKDGAPDLDAALANLSAYIAEKSDDIGYGAVRAELRGLNPAQETAAVEAESGGGAAEGSGSGSGCGSASGSNFPPVANEDHYTNIQGAMLNIPAPGVLANDYDDWTSQLTAHNVSQPAEGTVNLNTNGGFVYTPYAGTSGIDTFLYQARDGLLYSCYALVTIHTPAIDIDVDSDNNGTINGTTAEENVEMTNPGKVVAYNKDDDNFNGQADRLDTNTIPPVGSPMPDIDLVPAMINIDPADLNLANWIVQLTKNNSNIKLWTDQYCPGSA